MCVCVSLLFMLSIRWIRSRIKNKKNTIPSLSASNKNTVGSKHRKRTFANIYNYLWIITVEREKKIAPKFMPSIFLFGLVVINASQCCRTNIILYFFIEPYKNNLNSVRTLSATSSFVNIVQNAIQHRQKIK